MNSADLTELTRSIVRPIVTIIFSITVVVMFCNNRPIPELLQWTWLAIMGEWFGERLLFKLLGFNNETTLKPDKDTIASMYEKAIKEKIDSLDLK